MTRGGKGNLNRWLFYLANQRPLIKSFVFRDQDKLIWWRWKMTTVSQFLGLLVNPITFPLLIQDWDPKLSFISS